MTRSTGRRPAAARRGRAAAVGVATLLLAATAACGADETAPTAGGSAESGEEPSGEITVLAAASLTESFETIGADFEAANEGTSVTFSFGSSSTLATQVREGAPADVFAAANESTMQQVTDAGLNDEPALFATNVLEIAVPPGNPGDITGLQDFADENLRIAICAPEVPCGSAAEKVFESAGIEARPDTLEQDVKATLQKVQLDEVDAALVYRTDVVSAGDQVEGIPFDEAESAINNYPIATLTESANPELAQAFTEYVLSDEGAEVLSGVGFETP